MYGYKMFICIRYAVLHNKGVDAVYEVITIPSDIFSKKQIKRMDPEELNIL